MRKIRPIGDRVLLKRMPVVTQSAGGLFLPNASQAKSNQAVVAALGRGRLTEDGVLLEPTVKLGDHVVASKHAGQEVELGGEEFWLVREHDIMYVVEHPEDNDA
jgi:chaperonin GroES